MRRETIVEPVEVLADPGKPGLASPRLYPGDHLEIEQARGALVATRAGRPVATLPDGPWYQDAGTWRATVGVPGPLGIHPDGKALTIRLSPLEVQDCGCVVGEGRMVVRLCEKDLQAIEAADLELGRSPYHRLEGVEPGQPACPACGRPGHAPRTCAEEQALLPSRHVGAGGPEDPDRWPFDEDGEDRTEEEREALARAHQIPQREVRA